MANTGWLDPGTSANNTNVGSFNWSNHANAKANDGIYATSNAFMGGTSYYLTLTNYSAGVPTGATIDGIEFRVDRRKTNFGGDIKDSSLRLWDSGAPTGDDKADSLTSWPTSWTWKSYGGSSDLWGGSWSETDINDSGFGVVLSTTNTGSDSGFVDVIQMKVHYTAAAISASQLMTLGVG